MANMQDLNIMELERSYEEYMLKIGKEQFLEYYGSCLNDLYIMLQIEHDGVKDMALIDLLTDTVTMRVYDEYKFIITDQWKVTTAVFNYFIDEKDKYFDRVKNVLNGGTTNDYS